ncbi:hypothetical protein BCON_0090g00220 [Botryotinia convoluta]|uniref:FAD-binding PCMH-type domain-containing protein n=1 Tax=Botryotinia convoluta TaxID=54673 RepID=A0A4Z1I1S3_9HELO|nr:hypothetical protein BCON_0090g00220 [Botryotinia convoluta]
MPLPYWSVQQAEVVPSCRFDVTISQDISTTIKISQLTDCPFAVKSGGHASFAGASSIQNGILVNLQKLNTVQLSADRGTVSIGPGNTWYDVYQVLDPLGISVVGGREAGVGVGGLTLGGGISYFSGKYGWACDNILNYEVVLANGSIINASPTSHPDLYQALRGGSGTNFGIVTRFDAFAFEQGLLWGGSRFYSLASNASLSDVFSQFIVDAPTDEDAHLYIGCGYVPSLGGFVTLSGPVYAKPVANATIFNALNDIASLGDVTGVASMVELSVQLNQTAFLRWKTVTFKNNATLFKKIHEIFVEEANNVVDVPGIMPFMALQPLSLNIIEQMQKRSGNVLGLVTEGGPLSIMNLNWGWENEEDDEKVFTALNRFVERIVDSAKEWGLDNQFIYMNYASKDQNVFGGYGEVNEKKLRDIQRNFIRGGERKRDSVTPIAITILPGTVTSSIISSTAQPESSSSIERTTMSSTSATTSSQSSSTSATSVVQSTEGSKTTESKSATSTSITSSDEDNESKTSLSSATSSSQLVSSIISSTGGTAPARSSQVSNTETRDGSGIPTATGLTLTLTPPLNTAPTGKSSTQSETSSQGTSEPQASSSSSSQVSLQTTTFAPLPTTLPESSLTARVSSVSLDSSTLSSLNSVQTTKFPLLPTTSPKATATPESSSGETSERSSSATLTSVPTLVSSISVAPFGTGNSSTAATGIPQSSSNSDPSSESTVGITTEASEVTTQTSIRETLSPITVSFSTAGASSLVESVLSTKETSKATAQPQSTIAQSRTTVTQAPVSTTGASEQSITPQTSITGDLSQATSSDSLQTTFIYVTTVVPSSTLGVISSFSSSSKTLTSSIQVETTKLESSTSSFSLAAMTIKTSEVSSFSSSSEPQTIIFPELPTTQPASTAETFTTTVTPSTKTRESPSSITKLPTSTSSIKETTIQESVIASTTQRTTVEIPKTTEIASTIIISVNTADSNNGAVTALTIIPVTAGSGSKSNSGSGNDAPKTTTSDGNTGATTSITIINASPTATTTEGGNGLAQTTPIPLPVSPTPIRTSTSAIDDGLKTTTLSISPPRETSISINTAPAPTSAPVATSTGAAGSVCLGVGGDGKITSMSSCVGGATETVSVTVTVRG